MAVVREDVAKISFDIGWEDLTRLTEALDDIKAMLTGNLGDDAFDEMIRESRKATEGVEDIKDSLKGVKPKGLDATAEKMKDTADGADKATDEVRKLGRQTLTGLTGSLKTAATHLTTIAAKAGGAALRGLQSIAALSFKSLMAGLGAAGAAVWKFANMASDLEETKNKVDVAFGSGQGNYDGAAKDVMEWSKTSTTAMGLAQQTALDTAALFGDMGTSMGLTKDEAAKMSMTLTKQAADLASFKNLDINEAVTALNGVFTGEGESLKRLGVVMTQANLDQYALAKGIGKTTKEMSQAELVQLRYAYVMEMTKNATDDYQRTGGGFANQLRTMTENIKQIGTTLGQLPMTTFANGMKVINDSLADVQKILSDGFQAGDTEKIMNIVNGLIDKGVKALSDGLPKILPVVTDILSTVAESLIKAIPDVLPVLAKALIQLMVGIGKVIVENKDELVAAAKEAGTEIIKALYEGITGKEFNNDAFADFKEKVQGLLPVLGGLAAALGGLMGFTKLKSVFSGLFGGKDDDKTGGGGKDSGGLLGGFAQLAKMKPTVVLKGLANLAIILGGLTVLAAAFALVAPLIADLSDIGSLVETFAIVAALGVAGTYLAKSASAVGMIPVSKVALGLANIAIIIAGLTVLAAAFALAAPYIAELSDSKSLIEVMTIMTVLGALGAILTVFAGIAGAIPIPVVLMGLANIALVIGGLTALIAAYGALGSIPGFNEFIDKGGDTLANLFSQVGKIVGAVIGGIGEGLTASLPAIGENLSDFADSIAPMLQTFSSTDVSGVGDFLTALGSFIALAAGEKFLSWLTGGPDYAKLGTQLTDFANSSKGFFNTVATFPEAGFTNATKLFQSIADIGNVPNTGGIAQWFSGKNDFEGLATGLKKLSDEGVIGFFKAVATIPEVGFTNAKALFKSLADIGNVPNTGGVAQWFSGKNDLGAFGEQLKSFWTNAKPFFTEVGSINVSNVSELWKSVKKATEVAEADLTGLASKGTELSNFMRNVTGFFTGAAPLIGSTGAVNVVISTIRAFFVALNNLTVAGMEQVKMVVSNGAKSIVETVRSCVASITGIVSTINLYSEGADVMRGFNLGMRSQLPSIMSTALSMARAVKDTIDDALGINSPAKELIIRGEYTGEGQAIGMKNAIPKIEEAAFSMSMASLPFDSYSPDSSTVYGGDTAEYTTISPVFNLTISGSQDDRAMARRVKRYVAEAINDTFESLERKSYSMREA